MAEWKSKAFREKPEGAYGVKPVIAAVDAMLARNVRFGNLEGDWQATDFATGVSGSRIEVLHNRHAMIEYEIEAGPSGAAGVAPKYRRAILSCGMVETVVAATSVSYVPTSFLATRASSALEIGTDMYLQTILGARGSMSFSAEANRKPFFGFRKKGFYADPVALPDPWPLDFSGWTVALDAEPQNMGSFTLGGDTMRARSFSMSDGRSPVVNKFMNELSVSIDGRNWTGRATIEWPGVAVRNMVASSAAGTALPLVWEIGAGAGQRLRVAAPKVQVKFAGEADVEGRLAMNLDFVFLPDQGNDEIAFIFT